MLLLKAFILTWAFCHWAYGTDSHAFTMFQLSYFLDKNSVESVGNATLDSKLTHSFKMHNEQLNVSQLIMLEPSHVWEQRKSNLQQYLQDFHNMVRLMALERKVPYSFYVRSTQGCSLHHTGTTHSFYVVQLNEDDFLRFHTASATWVPLQDSELAIYSSKQLNKYNETTTNIQTFLQQTCKEFLREHTTMKGASTGQQQARSHTPLVLGITLGALALMGLAGCIFLCTGGKR